jgi:hypothetical protein
MPAILTVSPLENPSEYDKITIAGITTSALANGLVEVTAAGRTFDWDTKKSAGSQGQTTTYRGWDLAKPKIKFKFWTSSQIDAFYQSLVPPMYYDAEKTAPQPWDVYHPKLFASQIYWLTTKTIGDLTQDGAQLWSITVETLEYRRATSKNATTTPKESNTNQNGGETKPTVADRLREQIAREHNLAAVPIASQLHGFENQNRGNQ